MAYQSKARRPVKELREPVPGNGKALTPGKSCTVKFTTFIPEFNEFGDKITVTLRNDFGDSQVETIFIYNRELNDLSFIMKQLITALCLDTSEVKSIYDSILDGDLERLGELIERSCVVETEYNGRYINIKSIRSMNDRDNSGDLIQSSGADTSHSGGTTDTERFTGSVKLPEIAATFFEPRS